jgi:hypothetical protein
MNESLKCDYNGTRSLCARRGYICYSIAYKELIRRGDKGKEEMERGE